MRLTLAGRLEACFLLCFQVRAERVAALVPPGLELLTEGPWAYWNVVVSRLGALRPAGLPAWAGLGYHHVAYRLYVRGWLGDGGERRGLFFTRSDADRALLSFLGNRLSDFRFHRARIGLEGTGVPLDPWSVRVRSADGAGDLDFRATLPPGPRAALPGPAILRYNPLALCPDRAGRSLRTVRVVRDEAAWVERPLGIQGARFAYFEHLGLGTPALVRATWAEPLDYRWELGGPLPLAPR